MNDIATEIYNQLGGRKFAYITGCKNFVFRADGLLMHLPRNSSSANRLMIDYDEGADLYNMFFFRVWFSMKDGYKMKEVKRYDGLYCDMLTELFEEVTGLVTTMPRVIGIN